MHQGNSYFRMVNLKIPGVASTGNTGTLFNFPDQPDIRYARTTGIVAFTHTDINTCFPDNVAVLADADIGKVTLVLETNDPDDMFKAGSTTQKQKGEAGRFTGTLDTIQWLPLSMIHVVQGAAGVPFVRQVVHWKDRYIVWQKSQIQIAPGGLANTTDVAICLGLFYTFIDEFGKPISPRN